MGAIGGVLVAAGLVFIAIGVGVIGLTSNDSFGVVLVFVGALTVVSRLSRETGL